MGAALELGKLSTVAHLGQRYGALPLRLALVALVAALMALNSIGIYGYLAHSHIAQTVTAAARVDDQSADVKARIDVQQSIVGDLDQRIAQLDGMVQAATKRGYTRTAMALVKDQTARRADLERQRRKRRNGSPALGRASQGDRQAPAGRRRSWPGALSGDAARHDRRETMRWFILAVALLFDPAAVLLLFAAARIAEQQQAAERLADLNVQQVGVEAQRARVNRRGRPGGFT